MYKEFIVQTATKIRKKFVTDKSQRGHHRKRSEIIVLLFEIPSSFFPTSAFARIQRQQFCKNNS